ncbi:hypothetical protein KKC82_05280, partial [bacterium]|nr:hypothetical protein [bacterium]
MKYSSNCQIHNVDDFLNELSNVRKTSSGWMASCPAHEDENPSLSISEGSDCILIKCHAGCEPEYIMQSIGLSMKDLFLNSNGKSYNHYDRDNRFVCSYPYMDESGGLLFEVVRLKNRKDFFQRRPGGEGGFINNKNGVREVLYNLPAVLKAVKDGEQIFLPEGEKDCVTLIKMGFVATTNAGGVNGRWLPDFTNVLRGGNIILLGDNDIDGQKRIKKLTQELSGNANLKVIEKMPGITKKGGDITDWIKDGHTKEEFLTLVESTPIYSTEIELTSDKKKEQEEFKFTDFGNAERLISHYGKGIRYNVVTEKWMEWDGTRWKPDRLGNLYLHCKEVVRGMYQGLSTCNDERARSDLFKHVNRSESLSRIKAMLNLAEKEQGVPIEETDLDSNPMLFNCTNGTIDLRSGKLLPHNPSDLISCISRVNYMPDEECPRWMQFLYEIFQGDEELIDYVERVAGYSLTGDTSEQCFFVLDGIGSNGKSVFIKIMQHILGDLAKMTPFTTFLERRDISNTSDLAGLANVRLVGATEGNSYMTLNETLIKTLTGEDIITCRYMYKSFFSYIPQFKIFMLSNGIPNISSQSFAMKRRMKPIPFNVKFYRETDYKQPVIDKKLDQKLIAESEGILAWAVSGCKKWQETGLNEPEIIRQQVEEHFHTCDTLAEFLETTCIVDTSRSVGTTELWSRYSKWCDDRRVKPSVNSAKGLVQNLI